MAGSGPRPSGARRPAGVPRPRRRPAGAARAGVRGNRERPAGGGLLPWPCCPAPLQADPRGGGRPGAGTAAGARGRERRAVEGGAGEERRARGSGAERRRLDAGGCVACVSWKRTPVFYWAVGRKLQPTRHQASGPRSPGRPQSQADGRKPFFSVGGRRRSAMGPRRSCGLPI